MLKGKVDGLVDSCLFDATLSLYQRGNTNRLVVFLGGDRVLSGDHGIQKWKASVTSACQGKSLENEMK